MATDAAVKQFIAERQARLTPCFERGDVDQILTFYHKDLSFSDHAWNAKNLNYDEFAVFLRSTYDTSSSLRMETHGVYGTEEFCVWEWTLRVTAGVDDPVRSLVKGKEIALRGCSLHWWKKVEGTGGDEIGDWRIVKGDDYAVNAAPGVEH